MKEMLNSEPSRNEARTVSPASSLWIRQAGLASRRLLRLLPTTLIVRFVTLSSSPSPFLSRYPALSLSLPVSPSPLFHSLSISLSLSFPLSLSRSRSVGDLGFMWLRKSCA